MRTALPDIYFNYRDLPEYVAKKRRKCFACGKQHMMLIGSMSIERHKNILYKGTQYVVSVYAPIGCWLIHNKKFVQAFYKDKDNMGWKNSIRK